jgi:hypothetical protein
MGDMPNEIYVFPDPKSIGDRGFTVTVAETTCDGDPYTKYIRADIAEARIAKLEDALRFYADRKNYEARKVWMKVCLPRIDYDNGGIAREALKDVE